MKTKSTVLEDKSKGTTVRCFCNKCNQSILHTIEKSIRVNWEEDSYDCSVDGSNDYEIIKCIGCETYSFRQVIYCSEYRNYDDDGSYELLYPESTQYFHKKIEFEDLPYNLEKIYEESIKCYNNHQFLLCATGIRSILDGICIDRKIKGGTINYTKKDGTIKTTKSTKLDGKINGLNELGIITSTQTTALHELRFLGNKAVHELDIPTKKEIDIAFDIIEHILKDIYDLPIKAKTLESGRIKKKS